MSYKIELIKNNIIFVCVTYKFNLQITCLKYAWYRNFPMDIQLALRAWCLRVACFIISTVAWGFINDYKPDLYIVMIQNYLDIKNQG